MEVQIANQPAELQAGANAATKDDLLRRAKDAIDAGEQSLRDAAEALGVAEETHSASQREMAEAVRESVGCKCSAEMASIWLQGRQSLWPNDKSGSCSAC
jgi:cobalamin biosynthesis protein CbiG